MDGWMDGVGGVAVGRMALTCNDDDELVMMKMNNECFRKVWYIHTYIQTDLQHSFKKPPALSYP